MKHLIGMFILSLSVAAQAQSLKTIEAQLGPISSGGGMGVVCYNPDSTVKSVELLDLWEARQLYQREIIPSDKSVREQVLAGLENLKHSIDPEGYLIGIDISDYEPEGVEYILERLKKNANRFLFEGELRQVRRLRGVELSLTDDAYEVIRPLDCKLKQVVRYIDNAEGGEVIINQDLFDKMDSLNQAALYLHEVFYAMLRRYGEQSSIRVRRTIGLIFSGHIFEPWDKILPVEYTRCSGPNTNQVYLYKDEVGVALVISAVAGRLRIGNQDPSVWWDVEKVEDIWDAPLGVSGTLGFLTGNDFSYSFIPAPYFEGSRRSVYLELDSSPDQKASGQAAPMFCREISK